MDILDTGANEFDTALDNQVLQPDPQNGLPPAGSTGEMWDQAFGQASQNIQRPIFESTGYNPKTKERYKGDPSIYNDYFDPSADNERVAAENWTKWDAISAGFGGFKENFKASYLEAAYTWPRLGKAIFNMDMDYLAPSEKERAQIDMEQQKLREEYPIFYTPGTEDDFLTKGFMAETLQNLGFTFGTLSELATEWGITALASGALASTGGGTPIAGAIVTAEATATASKLARLGQFWKNTMRIFTGTALDDAAKLTAMETSAVSETLSKTGLTTGSSVLGTTTDLARNMNAQTNIGLNGVRTGINVWDNALKIASKVPIIGHAADATRIANAAKAGELTTGQLMKIGAGGLRRGFAEWQMAAGEASIEAGSNYGEVKRRLTKEYVDKYGEEPTGADLQEIRNLAMQSSTSDFSTNVAILAVSNRLMFGNMIGKFMPDSKAIAALRLAVSNSAAEAGVLGVRNAAGKTMLYQKGLLGTLGLAPQIAQKFGAKRAAWEVGKSAVKGMTGFQLIEGFQENLQEGTNEFLIDYYTDLYKGDVASWGKSFDEAVDSQMSKQGAKVFLMGAMTGMFVSPVVNSASYIASTTGINPALKAHRQSVAKSITALNEFFDKGSDNILKPTIKNIKLQTMYNDGMVEGLSREDKHQYYNNRDSSLIQTVLHAKRTGTMDYLNAFFKGYGENFTEEEFTKAFGYSPKELNRSSPKEVMDDISRTATRFSEIYDKYQTKFSMYMSIGDYLSDPAAKQKFGIKRAALMDAIETVAFAEAKGQQSTTRQAKILSSAASYNSIGNSLAGAFNTVTDPDEIDNQILLVENEMKTLRDAEQTDKTRELIQDKKKELELLSLYKMQMFSPFNVTDPNDATKKKLAWDVRIGLKDNQDFKKGVVETLAEYFALKNKQSGIKTPISMEEMNNAFMDIMDYAVLGREHAEYVEAVNFLNDPNNMANYNQKVMDARASAHARMIHEAYTEMGTISEVAKKWLDDPEQKAIMDEILKFSKMPLGSFENYNVLQKLKNDLANKFTEFETDAQKTYAEEQQKKAENAKKSAESRNLIDIYALYDDPNTRAQALEYMAMRYDLDNIKDNFPFESDDPSKRIVLRYYVGSNGERTAITESGFRGVRIPVEAELYEYDQNGNLVANEEGEYEQKMVKIDNFNSLLYYLIQHEQGLYNQQQQNSEQSSSNETGSTVEGIDNEKSKLINHVGTSIVLNGAKGKLETENDEFVIVYDDGSKAVLAPVSEDITFDSFTDLSIDHSAQPAENTGYVATNPMVKTDVQESGTVTIEMSLQNLDQATINGVTWNLERDQAGNITALVRERQRKKGKKTKTVIERMSLNNPKAGDYIRRIKAFLMIASPVPEAIDDAADELESLDEAIADAMNTVQSMEMRRQRSDELMAQMDINKLYNNSVTPEIAFLMQQWENPETRPDMSEDDMLKLFMWADDLRNKIKGKFRVFMGNRIVEGYMEQLIKEYINPISTIIEDNGEPSTKPKRATRRSSKEKDAAQQTPETGKPKRGKQDTGQPAEQPEGKKTKKRSVKTAVDSVEAKADGKRSKKSKGQVATSDTIQRAPIGGGTRVINNMSAKRISSIKNTMGAPEIAPSSENPFETLKPACEI